MNSKPAASIPFWQDTRTLGIITQALFAAGLFVIGAWLVNNLVTGLRASNIPLGYGFLDASAGFAIAEGPAFDPTQSYAVAYLIGIVNTLRVALVGIVLATLLGTLIGIARLSHNWLVRTIATVYVEIFRNVPLLVQLFFWYFAVILQLPDLQNYISLGDVVIISNRGVAIAWFYLTQTGLPWLWWLAAGLLAGILAARWRKRVLAAAGRLGGGAAMGVLAFVAVAAVGYVVTAQTAGLPDNLAYELRRGDRGLLFVDANGSGVFEPDQDNGVRYVPVTLLGADGAALGDSTTDAHGEFRFYDLPQAGEEAGEAAPSLTWSVPAPLWLSLPELQGFNVQGGRTLTPEYVGLLLGLVIYTAAFIAEIVRAGINAVPKGQWEASRAMGLSNARTLRLIVLPQALRVAVPPLTSQYLNLIKNSSLGIAIAYPDLFNVSMTILNQSGAAVQVFLLVMVTYLLFSLVTSAIMNWYNRRIQF